MGGPFSFASYCLPVFRIVDATRIGSLSSRAYGYECIRSLNERARQREREREREREGRGEVLFARN